MKITIRKSSNSQTSVVAFVVANLAVAALVIQNVEADIKVEEEGFRNLWNQNSETKVVRTRILYI